MMITGMIVPGGVECPLFSSDDGQTFSLTGAHSGLLRNQRVKVTGEITAFSFCQQGQTIDVQTIELLPTKEVPARFYHGEGKNSK